MELGDYMNVQLIDNIKVIKSIKSRCNNLIDELLVNVNDEIELEAFLLTDNKIDLITYDKKRNYYDVDYYLIVKKANAQYFSHPILIKDLILKSLTKICLKNNYQIKEYSSVTEIKIYDDVIINLDLIILFEGLNGNYFKLKYDSKKDDYFWIEIKKSNNFYDKLPLLDNINNCQLFKNYYLMKKNKNVFEKESFTYYIEALAMVEKLNKGN